MVGIASAGMGAVTFAYFQDADASSGNTVQSGTLNATIDGVDDGTTSDSSMTSGKPLDSTTKNYTIRNGGSTAANHLQINVSFSENDPPGAYEQVPGDSDLNNELSAANTAKYLEVTTPEYHDGTASTDLLGSINDGNGNNVVDLTDVQNHSATDDLTPPQAKEGSETYFEITVRIASDDHGLSDSDENVMGNGIDVTLYSHAGQQPRFDLRRSRRSLSFVMTSQSP